MQIINKLKKLISKIDTPLWLEIFFAIILILRIPSFFEPFYYGDEMIYLTLGQGIRQGIPLYLGLHDNKPPLLYLIAAIAGNVFWFKVLLAVFNLFSIYLFWKVVCSLNGSNKKFQKVSTIIFGILTTLPLFEGNIANAENFMMLPTMLAIIYILSKKQNLKNYFYTGLLFSMASLFKIVAAFDVLGIVFFIFATSQKREIILFIKKICLLGIGFILPILVSFVYFWFQGSFKEYLTAAFLQNIGYVSSWRPEDVSKPFLEKNLPLLIRSFIMFLGFGILLFRSKKLSKPFLFAFFWLLASLFAVTLSERPYPHYFLQAVAPISIFLGILVTYKNIEQGLTIIPLTIAFFVPFYFKFWYYPSGTYYMRFVKLATKQITKDEYLLSFSPNITENYKTAEFLRNSSNTTDQVFVWGNDSPAIYSLSRRLPPTKYVADYHFLDFSSPNETISMLNQKPPKFIVITTNSVEFPELREFVLKNYLLTGESNKNEIWMLKK